MRSLLADLTPLRVSLPFRRMWLGGTVSGLGGATTTTAVGLQVYELTSSTFAVGLVGLFALVPLVTLGLYGGSLVDAVDRRTLILVTELGFLLIAAALTVLAWTGSATPALLYGLVALQNGVFAINSPARSAAVPRLIEARLLPAANALTSLSFGVAMAVGPVVAGLLVASVGYSWTYAIEVVTVALAFVLLLGLPPLPPVGEIRRAGLASVIEGLRFLATRPNVRMTFLVDIAAMVLAMPLVLFPAIGVLVLGGGATTAGLLAGGIAIGTFLGGLFSGRFGLVRRQGRTIVLAVLAWAGTIVAFGIVVLLAPGAAPGDSAHWLLWPALACMVAAGFADTVSAVFRHTILQAATPDELRGRLQGVFIVVVAGGPRLGGLVLGAVATVTGEGLAAVLGGLACAVVVLLLAARQRGFLAYDAQHPTP